MNSELLALAGEALWRLEGSPLPVGRPQLLACKDGLCLLRTTSGLEECAFDSLPAVDLSPIIDHTILKADATPQAVDQLCDEAMQYGFASVCVNPLWVARCAARLQGSRVRTCTVVGFPLGATTAAQKAEEAHQAQAEGATEIDAVLCVGLAKAGDWEAVRQELALIRQATPGAILKLILETCLLSEAEKRRVCQIALGEGFEFVKTSTGFSSAGATEADIALMRQEVGASMGVKASGGIRSYPAALSMIRSGATRLGLSASVAISQG